MLRPSGAGAPALILALSALALVASLALAQQPTVTTTGGPISGAALPGPVPVFRFLGIPYAAAPLGALRWAAPVPASPWGGTLNATSAPSACSQNLSPIGESGLNGAPGWSEDCLYLNVWTPCLGSQCRLPVLFWLHGGYLTIGNSADPVHDGAALAALGAVVVTVNYRLGALGFLDTGVPGASNFGFQDQQLALRWAQRNIPAFGGDPSRVTLFGQSAGAWSVSAHLLLPSSAGLFRRAILQSGAISWWPNTVSFLPYLVRQSEALELGDKLFSAINCTAKDLSCARSRPAEAILRASAALGTPTPTNPFGPAFAAVRDGTVVPLDPVSALREGSRLNKGIDIVAGYTTNEGSYIVRDAATNNPFAFSLLASSVYGFGSCAALGTVGRYSLSASADYPGAQADIPTLLPDTLRPYQAWARDYGYTCPTRTLLQSVAAANANADASAASVASFWGPSASENRTSGSSSSSSSRSSSLYLYEFALVPSFGISAEEGLGATHGSDLRFVFGTGAGLFTTPDEARLSALMGRMWVRFAAGGAPTADPAAWPKWTAANESLVVFGPGVGVAASVPVGQSTVVGTFQRDGCKFLEPYPPTPPCGIRRPRWWEDWWRLWQSFV